MINEKKLKAQELDDRYPNECLITLLPVKRRENGQWAYALRLNKKAIEQLEINKNPLLKIIVTTNYDNIYPIVIGVTNKSTLLNIKTGRVSRKSGIFTSKTMYLTICNFFSISAKDIADTGYDIFFNELIDNGVYTLGGKVDLSNIHVTLLTNTEKIINKNTL